MKILKESDIVFQIHYYLEYDGGYANSLSFPCDSDGNPQLPPLAVARYQKALERGVPLELREYESRTLECAIGECDRCHRQVYLEGFTNVCPCGAYYNMDGQGILPPEEWDPEDRRSMSEPDEYGW